MDTSFELQQILPDNADKTMLISTLSTMAFIYYRTKKYKQSLDTYTGKHESFFTPAIYCCLLRFGLTAQDISFILPQLASSFRTRIPCTTKAITWKFSRRWPTYA